MSNYPNLDRLEEKHIFEVKAEDGAVWFYEICKGYFSVGLHPDQVDALADELRAVAQNARNKGPS